MLGRVTLAAALIQAGLALASASSCDSTSTLIDACTVDNTGSQIDIGATTTAPGDGGDTGTGGVAPRPTPTLVAPECVPGPGEFCRGNYTVASLPDVTMADLASFRPSAPSLASEPAGIGIAGAPTNFVVSAAAHTATGTLFGYPVTVRFSPVEFRLAYGDGATRTAVTPGASWDALGQPQFTPTGTSHAYARRGEYAASVTTVYSAQVDFGRGWRDVPGTLPLAGPAYPVRIVEARTALVDHTCAETPTAPGC